MSLHKRPLQFDSVLQLEKKNNYASEGYVMPDTMSNMTGMNIGAMVRLLSKTYITLIEAGKPFSSFPAVMLWGAPGVGKSQGVRQIAGNIERHTGRKVHITDVRLLLFNPVDLRGIPTANADRTLAVWLRPSIFEMDPSDDVVNILFLDEISAAPQSVQAAAYQITLDRTIGEHHLPENCIVIAAGNRVTDRSVAYNMPNALANRLCHLEIRENADAWHDWAVGSGIHPFVVGYLDYNPAALMYSSASEVSNAFPTPRSWEMTSNILNHISDDMGDVMPLIAGCIGDSTATAFRKWTTLYQSIPDPEVIFSGEDAAPPKAEELRTALRSSLVAFARIHPEKEGIDHSIEFACKLPWSFRANLLHDYSLIPEVRCVMESNAVFKAARKRGLK